MKRHSVAKNGLIDVLRLAARQGQARPGRARLGWARLGNYILRRW
jgi:hypothetical protein